MRSVAHASTATPSRALSLRGAKFGPMIAMTAATAAAVALSPLIVTPARADVSAGATVQTPMGRAPLSFADLVEKVKPSVVSVSVANEGNPNESAESGDQQGRGGLAIPELPEDHPLHDFFKNLPRQFGTPNQGQPRVVQGQGSGFVISADGYIVTNNHVIDGATKIEIAFDDQSKFTAKLVGTDARTDIALLKIDAPGKTFPFVSLSDKDPRVGDWALAVGNPFGLGGSVTAGIVSALARDIGSGPYDYLQIDAAVNRGNSGGPTFNLDGSVIGVNTAIYSPSGGNVGIAFAVPAKTVAAVVDQLRKSGSVSRGWLGVKIQNIDADVAASIGLATPKGALISEVTANGPAAKAGLATQDAIMSVNGETIEDSRDLARKIAGYDPDTTVDVKIWRNSGEKNMKVKLGLFPANPEAAMRGEPDKNDKPAKTESLQLSQLGITLMPARTPGAEGGVAIAEIEPSSDAAQKGLKAGDIILEVSGQQVKVPNDVVSGVKKAQELKRSAVLLHIKSADQTRFVAVQLRDKKS